MSIRDLLAWVEFICRTTNDMEPETVSESSLVTRAVNQLDLSAAYVHGACIVFVDALVTSGHLLLCLVLLCCCSNRQHHSSCLSGCSSLSLSLFVL